MEKRLVKRQSRFQQQILSYLPYVFNDHFTLVLVVFLGFFLYQYREWLLNPDTNSAWLYVVIGLVSLPVLLGGRIATYLVAPDQHYLLPKEEDLLVWVERSRARAFLFGTLVQAFSLTVLVPIFLKLGWSFATMIAFLGLMTVAKWLLIKSKSRVFFYQSGLNWERLIRSERKRQERLLKFFALFTRVKGLSSSVSPRPYLNSFLKLTAVKKGQLHANLLWRVFLRSGDYLGLYLRLQGLGLLVLVFVKQTYVAAGLFVVCQFLWQFQLLGLGQHYDHHPNLLLSPVGKRGLRKALLQLLRRLAYPSLLLGCLISHNIPSILILALGAGILHYLYLPYKIKAMIDEVG